MHDPRRRDISGAFGGPQSTFNERLHARVLACTNNSGGVGDADQPVLLHLWGGMSTLPHPHTSTLGSAYLGPHYTEHTRYVKNPSTPQSARPYSTGQAERGPPSVPGEPSTFGIGLDPFLNTPNFSDRASDLMRCARLALWDLPCMHPPATSVRHRARGSTELR
eukprot:365695-Chlamydomonas_euryale.AAC.3